MDIKNAFHELFESQETLQYFKELYYYKDEDFFQLDKYDVGPRLYMNDISFYKWAEKVRGDRLFSPEMSYSKLEEKRSGEFSNATLYSSSRMAVELFSDRKKVGRLCKNLGIRERVDHIELEHRFPISGLPPRSSTRSHMDVVIWCEHTLIAVECKMQEIYNGSKKPFLRSYKDLLEEKGFTVYEKGEVLDVEGFTKKYKSFDFKQQICHILGLGDDNGLYEKVFVNLVFDPSDIMKIDNHKRSAKSIKDRFENLKSEEKMFYSDPTIKKINGGIIYGGLFNQCMERIN